MESIGELNRHPYLGRERPDLSWRMKKIPRWLLFFVVREDGTPVFLRVRSGTMNLIKQEMVS